MITYKSFIDSPFNDWQEIDTIVSRDCTLRCSYCYLTKHKDELYDTDSIIKSLDVLLKQADEANKEGVILGFYPEPWVDIQRSNELISRSLNSLLQYPRFTRNFMIMIGTNGVLLNKPIPILEKFADKLSLAVTIDGIKEQHDMYRVFPNGSPSFDIVKKNILDNQKKYNIYSTKVTLGPDTLKYIYESSLFLWDEMGFCDVNMNVVFEDLWGTEYEKQKSLELFEEQISKLTDDIVKNRRWEHRQYQELVGDRMIVKDLDIEAFIRPYCGATMMRSIDSDGSIYPCFRLSPYSLNEDKTFKIVESQRNRSLKSLNNFDSAPEKCRSCDLLSICSMCVGGAFEEYKTLYSRTTHHCEFVKIQNKYATKLQNIMNEVEND